MTRRKNVHRTWAGGFTLIELLVVVAIIAILAAIGAANYRHALERTDKSACQQNLRTVHTALASYKLDQGRFPPADGIADFKSHPDRTEWGCGPSANGYWSGVSLLLAELGYCPESALFCPALKRQNNVSIEAWPSCSSTEFSGKSVPQWRFLRFAYNAAATDVGGYGGGDNNIEKDWEKDVWLVRCLNIDVGDYYPERDIRFPFRFREEQDGLNREYYGEFELTVHGSIRPRLVHQ